MGEQQNLKKWANLPIKYLSEILGVQITRKRAALYSMDDNGDMTPEEYRRLSCAQFSCVNARTLKSSAIRLYLALYFYTNSIGIGEEIPYAEMAALIECTERTVHNSLEKLKDSGYIEYSKVNPRCFSVSISGYGPELFAKMSKGGAGFITVSEKSLNELMSLKALNDIRLFILCLLRCNENAFKSASKSAACILRVSEIKRSLPGYIRPSDIKRSITNVSSSIGSVKEKYKEYAVILSDSHASRRSYTECRNQSRARIKGHMADVARLFVSINDSLEENRLPGIKNVLALRDLGIGEGDIYSTGIKKISIPYLSSADLDSLSSLSAQHGIEEVINSINIFIEIYCLSERSVKFDSPAAVVTKILKESICRAS